ncbi:MAG: glycosyltransferase family 2 protein [Fervidobacterium sp.]|nr:glycosyltransferase family 2 protein [Fervidobacterium sp.]MBP9517941.1 glycosyltransferase family 2 protein [Fervidobacterium sp.]
MHALMSSIVTISTFVISILYFFSIRPRILRKEALEQLNFDELRKKFNISVIIPARNEEVNIGKILTALLNQSVKVNEIIVVNDNSSDKTAEIVEHFSKLDNRVRLINLLQEPPDGWIGKSWALWNGVLNSSGDLLILFDADVEPNKETIGVLLDKYDKYGGMISVWPYQRFERFYEHLALAANLMSAYGSKNFGFLNTKPAGVFGPVIVTSRKDYFETGGHEVIKDSVLDDFKIGQLYLKKGKSVTNFLGKDVIKFRMYPNGLGQLFEGYTKNMSSGAMTGGLWNFVISFVWMAGIYSSIFTMFDSLWRFGIYLAFTFIIYILSKPIGNYVWYDYFLYPVHFLFFLLVFVVSIFKTLFLRRVSWRGRAIRV